MILFKQGYVRFDEKDGAKKAFDSITGSLKEGETPKLGDDDTELRIVEGLCSCYISNEQK